MTKPTPRKMRDLRGTIHDEGIGCVHQGCVPVKPGHMGYCHSVWDKTKPCNCPGYVEHPAPLTHKQLAEKANVWFRPVEEVAQPESPAPMSARKFYAVFYNNDPDYVNVTSTPYHDQSEMLRFAEAFAAQSQPPEQEQFNRKWQLVRADKEVEFLMDGDLQVSKLRYHREGESMSTGNVGAWYASAVFWREMYDRLKAQSQPSESQPRAIPEAELQRVAEKIVKGLLDFRAAHASSSNPRDIIPMLLAILRTLEGRV